MVNPILPLALAVEEDPNVLIAKDNGMEVDAVGVLSKHRVNF